MTEKLVQRLLILGIVAILLWFPTAYIALNIPEPFGVFGLYLAAIAIAVIVIVRKRPRANS